MATRDLDRCAEVYEIGTGSSEAGAKGIVHRRPLALPLSRFWSTRILPGITAHQFDLLRPLNVDDLIRVGRDHDGGYVISERTLACTDLLIGLGINDDWSFEADFLRRRPNTPLIAVDGTVSAGAFRRNALQGAYDALRYGLRGDWSAARQQAAASTGLRNTAAAFREFFGQPGRRFVNRMLMESSTGAFGWPDLMHMVDEDAAGARRLFVKMDIEGAEYRVLPELLPTADRIAAIVIEFHDCDLLWERFMEVMDAMLTRFVIVHTHGNNCAPLMKESGIPRVLEISLANRDLISAEELARRNDRTYPLPTLDMPNQSDKPDYPLRFGKP